MAALGGSPGKPRTVTYVTKDERKEFQFSGGIIAISNVPLSRDPLADAVASRVVLLEHEPSDEMLAAFMRDRAAHGYEDMTPEECLAVVEFVIAETRACDYRLDLRYMKKAWQDYRMDKHGLALRPWKELVRSSLKRVVTPEQAVGRSDRKAWEQQVALDLFQKYPDDKPLRDEEWFRLTGKASDSLYGASGNSARATPDRALCRVAVCTDVKMQIPSNRLSLGSSMAPAVSHQKDVIYEHQDQNPVV